MPAGEMQRRGRNQQQIARPSQEEKVEEKEEDKAEKTEKKEEEKKDDEEKDDKEDSKTTVASEKPSFIMGGSISQGTPGTYLSSHNQAYPQEAPKPSVGSISLGLPRQQESTKAAPLTYIKQEEFSPRSQNSQPEGLLVRAQHEGVVRGTAGAVQEGSITRGTPASKISVETISSLRGSITQGTPALPQAGIPTEALVKGPVSRMPIEESSPEKVREEAASKGHVIYEGKSGHILSYDNIKNAREGTRSPRTEPHSLPREVEAGLPTRAAASTESATSAANQGGPALYL